MKKINTFQGASIHTERKEYEIGALTLMRFRQFKCKYFKPTTIIVGDIFSGTGRNVVNDELIDGSPIRIIEGILSAKNTNVEVYYFFSDIRPDACQQLHKYILERFKVPIETNTMAASDALNVLGTILKNRPDYFLYLVIDPNGPKDFPKNEIHDLLSEFPRRIDIIPNISATTINRCLGARNKAGRQMKGWLGMIDNFDDGFIKSLTMNGRNGWIRKPLEKDIFRWVMIPTFGCMNPRNDWKKQGYVDLASDEGKSTVKFYCGEF